MYQSLGDFLNYIIIAIIGVICLISYWRTKKVHQLWLGIILIMVGVILGLISSMQVKKTSEQEVTLESIINSIEEQEADSSEVINDYKKIIKKTLEKSDTTTTKKVVLFYDYPLTLPKGTAYNTTLEELLVSYSNQESDLVVNFRKDNLKSNNSFSSHVESLIKRLSKPNKITPYQEFSNREELDDGSIIQYDTAKRYKGVVISKGKTIFLDRENELIRISFQYIGEPSQLLVNQIASWIEEIKSEKLLQQ